MMIYSVDTLVATEAWNGTMLDSLGDYARVLLAYICIIVSICLETAGQLAWLLINANIQNINQAYTAHVKLTLTLNVAYLTLSTIR